MPNTPSESPGDIARDHRLRRLVRQVTGKKEPLNPLRSGLHSRGYLPHLKVEGAAYFTTFRTDDSLPKSVYLRLLEKRRASEQRLCAIKDDEERRNMADETVREFQREIERILDTCLGECHLRRSECAAIVAQALKFFDRDRYHLKAWVVMPNHVHTLVWPKPPHTLSEILKSWKGFTAREINKVIGKTGARFWQPESFDRWLRGPDEEPSYRKYIENNPVKAKLSAIPDEWRWSSAWRRE